MYWKRILSFAALFIFALALVHTNALQSWSQDDPKSAAQGQDEKDIPIVDYEVKKSGALAQQVEIDRTRTAKGKRYDRTLAVRDLDTGGNPVLTFSHWDAALPVLPVGRSALVIVGQTVDAKAFLSNDTTGIYSEFTVSIDQRSQE